MAKLLINAGTRDAVEVELKPGANYLGRGESNDLIFEDGSVSTSHAEIYVNGASVRIKDLGSTNGTYINRELVRESVLVSGQIVRLGGIEMIFKEEPRPVVSAPVATMLVPTPPLPNLPPRPPATATRPAKPAVEIAAIVQPQGPVATPAVPEYSRKTSAELPKLSVEEVETPASQSRTPVAGSTVAEITPATQEKPERLPSREKPARSLRFPNESRGEMLWAVLAFFGSSSALVMAALAMCLAGADFVAGAYPKSALAVQVLIVGFAVAYLQKIVRLGTQAPDREAPLPDFTRPLEEFVPAFAQTLGSALACFGPALLLGALAHLRGTESASFGILPATVLGCAYFPMAFLMVTMFDTVTAVSPATVLPSMTKVPGQCALLGGVLFIAVATLIGSGGTVGASLNVPIVLQVILKVLGVCLLALEARMLGVMYFTNRRKLAWFSRGAVAESY